MLARLALVLTVEVAGLTVTGEVVGLVEEGREDIKLPVHSFLLKTYKIYSSLRRAINLGPGEKQWAKPNLITKEGWAM